MVRTVPAPFQVVFRTVAGSTLTIASTLRASMASLNVISTAARRSVADWIDRNASSATALIGGAGAVAVVVTGRDSPIAATRTTIPTLAISAARAATERRASSGR